MKRRFITFFTTSNKSVEIVFAIIFFVGRFKRSSSFFLWRYLFLHEEISFLQQEPIFQGKIFCLFFLLFTEKISCIRRIPLFPLKNDFFQLFQCIFPLSTEVNSENSPKESTKQIYTQELKVLWDERVRQNYKYNCIFLSFRFFEFSTQSFLEKFPCNAQTEGNANGIIKVLYTKTYTTSLLHSIDLRLFCILLIVLFVDFSLFLLFCAFSLMFCNYFY